MYISVNVVTSRRGVLYEKISAMIPPPALLADLVVQRFPSADHRRSLLVSLESVDVSLKLFERNCFWFIE